MGFFVYVCFTPSVAQKLFLGWWQNGHSWWCLGIIRHWKLNLWPLTYEAWQLILKLFHFIDISPLKKWLREHSLTFTICVLGIKFYASSKIHVTIPQFSLSTNNFYQIPLHSTLFLFISSVTWLYGLSPHGGLLIFRFFPPLLFISSCSLWFVCMCIDFFMTWLKIWRIYVLWVSNFTFPHNNWKKILYSLV